MRYLVFLSAADEEPVEHALILDGSVADLHASSDPGRLIFGTEVDLDVLTSAELRSPDGNFFAIDPASIRAASGDSPENAEALYVPRKSGARELANPKSSEPYRSPYLDHLRVRPEPIASTTTSTLPPDLPPAGVPGPDRLPVNGTASVEVNTYLAPDDFLGPESDWVRGKLYEYETYSEPLGWALDEWVDTVSLGPFEDTRLSEVMLSRESTTQSADDGSSFSSEGEGVETQGGAAGSVDATQQASGRSRGFKAGIGGVPADKITAAADPIRSLLLTLTGSVQLGYSSTNASTDVATHGSAIQAVASRIQRAAEVSRLQSSLASASATGSLRDSRRLRALRNLEGGKTANLAVFSVVRQWLVTTVLARTRPVVFVQPSRINQPFTLEDVFLHRQALAAVITDPELTAALDSCARNYVPGLVDPPADLPPASTRLLTIEGTARVDDPASGRDSHIDMTIELLDESKVVVSRHSNPLNATRGSDTLDLRTLIDKPVPHSLRLKFGFDNPGVAADRKASLIFVELNARLSTSAGLYKVPLNAPPAISLKVGEAPFTFTRKVPLQTPVETPASAQSVPLELSRLLAYLNASCALYRLAIDLQRDQVTRFRELTPDKHKQDWPVDLQPVGYAGQHLAFLVADDKSTPQPSSVEPRPIQRVVSTPSSATFLEAGFGKTRVTAVTPTADWPAVVTRDKEAITWPEPVEPTASDVTPNAPDLPDTDKTEPPTPPSLSDLLAKITDLKDLVKGLEAKLADGDDEETTTEEEEEEETPTK